MGAVEFGGKYNYLVPGIPLVSTNKQQDGNLNGMRTDAIFSAPAQLFGLNGVLNLKGFYTWFSDTTTLACTSDSLSANCDGVSLFEPSLADNNTLGADGVGATYLTRRKVQHWGMAFEGAPVDARIANLQQQFGIAYKAIDQDMNLTSTWEVGGHRQDYNERLNTGYLGPYWGASGRQTLSAGMDLIYGGEAGVYWAHTTYGGALNQTDFSGTYSQNLKLKRNKVPFIGTLSLALEQQFQDFVLAGYASGEYYSYAPQMAYNQTDHTGGVVIIHGPNNSTHICDTNAWAFTVGVRLRF